MMEGLVGDPIQIRRHVSCMRATVRSGRGMRVNHLATGATRGQSLAGRHDPISPCWQMS